MCILAYDSWSQYDVHIAQFHQLYKIELCFYVPANLSFYYIVRKSRVASQIATSVVESVHIFVHTSYVLPFINPLIFVPCFYPTRVVLWFRACPLCFYRNRHPARPLIFRGY